MPKRPINKELADHIIKSVTAVVCTAAVSGTALSSVDKLCEAELEIAKKYAGKSASGVSKSYASSLGSVKQQLRDNAENFENSDTDSSGESENTYNISDVNSDTEAQTVSVESSDKKAKKYSGPLLKHDIIPFNFSEHDPDPSKWTTQEIVDCYKSGMAKEDHDGVQTDMVFQLIGDLPGAASALKGPVNLAMKLGAQPYDDLTGGYWDLQTSDLKRADAHKEGNYVVINLYPKEQVDGPNGDEHKGSVGHVVNVVEGIDDFIAYVEENFGILHAYYEDDSIVLKYPDAYAKNIKINTKTGKMESGTWGYDVDIYLDHCGVLGVDFHDFHTAIRWKCWYPVED